MNVYIHTILYIKESLVKLFDKILLRSCAVLFLITILGISGTTLYSLMSLRDSSTRHQAPEVVLTDEDTQEEQRLQLGSLTKISTHAQSYNLSLHAVQKPSRRFKSSSYYNEPIRNYLFVNPATDSQQWLFPSNNQHITKQVRIYTGTKRTAQNSYKPTSFTTDTVSFLLYSVIDIASNSDGERAPDAPETLYRADITGTQLTPILNSVDHILSIEQHEPQTTLINYYDDGRYYLALLDSMGTLEKTIHLNGKQKVSDQ